MLTRREFLISLPALAGWKGVEPLRFAAITDLHYGLAPDAYTRLQKFTSAVRTEGNIDAVLQLGDFCYGTPPSQPCLDLFATLPHRKIHVLGNHDMDQLDKKGYMAAVGMKSRFGLHEFPGFNLVVLDLNHLRRGEQRESYAKGNYFASGVTVSWADGEQLEWLRTTLLTTKKPVILLSHQPLGFKDPGKDYPPEQLEVLHIIARCAKENPRGAVICCIFGHLHVDRLEFFDGIPCLCLNSASYFWSGGMIPYSNSLFAFLELTSDRKLRITGVEGKFLKEPPRSSDTVIGRSASLSSRSLSL